MAVNWLNFENIFDYVMSINFVCTVVSLIEQKSFIWYNQINLSFWLAICAFESVHDFIHLKPIIPST